MNMTREEKELELIIKYSDSICQEPGEPINQKIKNAVKIALRIGFNAGKNFNNKS